LPPVERQVKVKATPSDPRIVVESGGVLWMVGGDGRTTVKKHMAILISYVLGKCPAECLKETNCGGDVIIVE